MFEAEVLEFPAFAELPRREKSKVQSIWDTFQALSKIVEEKGMLIPQSFAAKILGISRQRVHQLVETGQLESYELNETPFVTEKSVIEYASSERKSGRPLKLPKTRREMWMIAKDQARGK